MNIQCQVVLRDTIPRLYKNLNANEETLLPLLWLNPRPLQDRIRARNAYPLRCGRTLQVQHARLSELLPRGLQRIADSEEDSATHEQRWFTWSMLVGV